MIKVVINGCHGGFGLSNEAIMHLINTKSELVITYPVTEYTGEDSVADALCDLSSPSPVVDLGNGFWSNYYGVIFNTETNLVYEIGYPMSQQECETDEDWWHRQDFREILLRTHPDLISVVEELGNAANGRHACLNVREVPDEDVTVDMLGIGEYDGSEWVCERHRTW